MGQRAAPQRRQFIAAFQDRYDAALRVSFRDAFQRLRHPHIVRFGEPQHRHVVVAVRVESGRDQQQLGLETFQRGQPVLGHRSAEPFPACPGGERHIDDMFVAAAGAAIGVERMLEGGAQHHARLVVKNVLRAVAVMHVEIRDRDAPQAVLRQRVRRADRDVIEDAEAHRARALGMVAGRADVAKGVLGLARHHQIDAQHHRARRAQCGRIAERVHRRVAVELHDAVQRRAGLDGIDVARSMHAQQLLARRLRRIVAL